MAKIKSSQALLNDVLEELEYDLLPRRSEWEGRDRDRAAALKIGAERGFSVAVYYTKKRVVQDIVELLNKAQQDTPHTGKEWAKYIEANFK